MALLVMTTTPKALWGNMMKAIKEGEVSTWAFHTDELHFTHKAEQWKKQAWFKPVISEGLLAFNIVKPKGNEVTVLVYAEYHGFLLRMLLTHFDKSFSNALVTAQPTEMDVL